MSPTDDAAAAIIPELLAELRALRAQVTQLTSKVTSLEGAARAELEAASGLAPATALPAAPAAAPGAEPVEGERLPDELLLVISAAVAAFLGKRARIRGIRVLSSASWAHQGRVSIQASHALPSQR
jgi:methylmalonyl-CoA carboxyltransferase large subunit